MERFYKTSYELCFYYVWALFIIGFFFAPGHETNVIQCFFVIAGVFVINLPDIFYVRKKWLRMIFVAIGTLLPAVGAVFGLSLFFIPEVVLPWIYYLVCFFGKKQDIWRMTFIDRFKLMPLAFIPLLFMVLFNPDKGKAAARDIYSWLIMFFVSGVLELQNLRWKNKGTGKTMFEKRQIPTLFGFMALAIVITVTDWIERLNTLLIAVLINMGKAIGVVTAFIYGLYMKLMKVTVMNDKIVTSAPTPAVTDMPAQSAFQSAIDYSKAASVETQPFDKAVFIFLGFVFLIIVLILLMTRKKVKVYTESGDEKREKIDKNDKKEKHGKKTPVMVIRSLYKKYMERVSDVRLLDKADTTEDIRNKASVPGAYDVEGNDIIKHIYREVRYNENVTATDVKVFKEEMKRLSIKK